MKDNILSTDNIKRYMNNPQSYNIIVEKTVDSTNNVLKKMARMGEKHGTVVVAEEQTAGRGRFNRSFFSPKKDGVYLSILLRPDMDISKSIFLTCVAAIAVSESIEQIIGQKTSIKWVNDIELNGREICGILTEGAIRADSSLFDYAIVGIGVNITEPKDGYPEEISKKAGAFYDANTSKDIRNELVANILEKFMNYYTNLNESEIREKYKERSSVLDQDIYIISGENVEEAHVLDLADDLSLLVETKHGKKILKSGEISIRRRVDNENINDI